MSYFSTKLPFAPNYIFRVFSSLAWGLVSFGLVLMWTDSPAIVQASALQAATGFNPQELLRNALEWVNELGAVGAVAFIALYLLATVAFFPGSILTLGAGVVFGVGLGSLYVFIGATLGATAAFLVGRYLARAGSLKKLRGIANSAQSTEPSVGKDSKSYC
jgi:uncharacterized membrane protein YdjX (TVP38/TMEM64 family)